ASRTGDRLSVRVRIEEFTRTFAALDTSLYTLDEDVDFLGRVLLTNNVLAALDEQRRIVAFIAYGDGKSHHSVQMDLRFDIRQESVAWRYRDPADSSSSRKLLRRLPSN